MARIKPRADEQREQFQRQADPKPAPQAEADLQIAPNPQIGHVNGEIENPVREHRRRDDEKHRAALCAHEHRDDPAEDRRQDQRADQSVCIGHEIEIERAALGEARNDAHLLDAQQHEARPDHVQPLYGDEINPQRNAAYRRLGAECRPIMPDEHDRPPKAVRAQCSRAFTACRIPATALETLTNYGGGQVGSR